MVATGFILGNDDDFIIGISGRKATDCLRFSRSRSKSHTQWLSIIRYIICETDRLLRVSRRSSARKKEHIHVCSRI